MKIPFLVTFATYCGEMRHFGFLCSFRVLLTAACQFCWHRMLSAMGAFISELKLRFYFFNLPTLSLNFISTYDKHNSWRRELKQEWLILLLLLWMVLENWVSYGPRIPPHIIWSNNIIQHVDDDDKVPIIPRSCTGVKLFYTERVPHKVQQLKRHDWTRKCSFKLGRAKLNRITRALNYYRQVKLDDDYNTEEPPNRWWYGRYGEEKNDPKSNPFHVSTTDSNMSNYYGTRWWIWRFIALFDSGRQIGTHPYIIVS